MLNFFNKLKYSIYDMCENDNIQYMFKTLTKELQIAFPARTW